MAQPVDEPSTVPASGPSAVRARSARPRWPVRPGVKRTRQRMARVVVRKVGPWSIFKLSLFFYLCVMLVVLGAFTMLYLVLGAIGALDSVTRLIRDLFADQSFRIHGAWLLGRAFVVGLAMVVLWSLINVFVTFLYNLISDVVGGVEITLAEKR
jgi:Transmembrane domain of unknown function (DUF3566)